MKVVDTSGKETMNVAHANECRLNPGEIREMLAEAGIDITASDWGYPGFVIANGATLAPCMLPGVLIVDGQTRYSAAWL